MNRALWWVAISDGGTGIEDWPRANFPRVEAVSLGFFHAAERLGPLALVLRPVQAEAGRWCHRLKHEGGRAVLASLRGSSCRAG